MQYDDSKTASGVTLIMENNYDVPNEVRDKIIKDYMIKSYHWTIGLGMFLIGLLLGALIGG
jgi:hypothetical protein